MSLAYTPDRLRLPDSLQAQLHEFRRRVWTIKMVEAVAAAAFGVLVAYLLLFCLDRVLGHAGLAARRRSSSRPRSACANIPLGLAPLGLAASPARATGPAAGAEASAGRRPVAGDHRAGAQRLRAGAVAGPVRGRDPRGRPRRRAGAIFATPSPTRGTGSGSGWWPSRWRSRSACSPLFPAAAANAWQRFLVPWRNAPRYTFTDARAACRTIVVAARRAVLGRPASSRADTAWRPGQGVAQLGAQHPVVAQLARRPLRLRAAAADRSGLAGHQDRRRVADACASSRPCGPS